jgi:predicted HAD superfamily Cof-like phosphohydrolase
MNKMQRQVLEFHKGMGLEYADTPHLLASEASKRRIMLIDEEFLELIEARNKEDLVEMSDALCDLLYVVFGTAVEMGLDLEPLFDEVHKSNMTKVGGHKNNFGKWIKPDTYQPPKLAGLINKQRERVTTLLVPGDFMEEWEEE